MKTALDVACKITLKILLVLAAMMLCSIEVSLESLQLQTAGDRMLHAVLWCFMSGFAWYGLPKGWRSHLKELAQATVGTFDVHKRYQ